MSEVKLTARDHEIICAAFRSLKNAADIDYDKLALHGKFKNAASARACFAPVMKRLNLMGDAVPIARARKAAAPSDSKGRGQKRKAAKREDSDEDGDEPEIKKVKPEPESDVEAREAGSD